MRLFSEVVSVDQLTAADRSAMLDLMQRHYENVLPDRFFHDLEQKHSVILVREPKQCALCGFSTQAIVEQCRDDRRRVAFFSGDTIIDRRYWGDPALGQAWGRFVLQWIDEHPDAECDWFLISQGFRTYRYLSLFFREFYPRYDRPTPPDVAARIAGWAKQLFGDRFDPVRGVIHADADGYSLRDDLAQTGDRALGDPHIAHFLRMNPGHRRGDELCCLAPLSRENFTRAAWRVIDRRVPVDVG